MTLSPNLLNQRRRVLLAKLGNDDSLLQAYLSRVPPEVARDLAVDPKVVEALLAERDSRPQGKPEGPRSPLYQAPLLCPGHKPLQPFPGWFSLGHQRVEENLLGVPRTLGGMDGYAPVDYVLLEAQVCPVCFYASPFRQDFGKPPAALPERAGEVLEALTAPAARAERRQTASGGSFWDPARGAGLAREAFVLALLSARTAREAGESAADYKQAHIRLRLARLDEDAGDPAAARAQYEGALAAVLAYRSVQLPDEPLARTCRQIVILAVMLGQDALGAQQRSFLFESRTKCGRRLEEQEKLLAAAQVSAPESALPALRKAEEDSRRSLAAFTRHFAQADAVWQDRDLHRLRA